MHVEYISQIQHLHQRKWYAITHLAYGEDVVDVQALEERPHCEVHVDKTTAKVQSAREARDDLQARFRGRARRRRGSIQADELTRTRRGVGEDLADLQGVRLDVLRKARPRQCQVVAHEIIDGETRDEGCRIETVSIPNMKQSLRDLLSAYGNQNTVSPGKNSVLSPGPCPTVLATSKSLSLTAPLSPSVSASTSVSTSVPAPHGPLALIRARRRACEVGSPWPASLPWRPFTRASELWPLSLRGRLASKVRRIAAVRSASAWDHTVRHTPWYVIWFPPAAFAPWPRSAPPACPCEEKPDGPRYAEDGRAPRKGSSPYWYGKETMEARGSELAVMTDARRRSVEGDGARGVAGAGSV